MFLALDPATKTGWAAWKPGMDRPASGSFDLPSIEDDLGAVGFRVHVELNRLLTVHGFERLFYEAPIPPSQLMGQIQLVTIAKIFTIAGHIESFCYAKKLRCRQVGMGAWRRHFVGKGAGEKTATFKSWARDRCRQLGWNVRSHDEADACGILAYAVSLDPAFSPPWREQLDFAEQFTPKKKAARA
jgi:hypothetical protein